MDGGMKKWLGPWLNSRLACHAFNYVLSERMLGQTALYFLLAEKKKTNLRSDL